MEQVTGRLGRGAGRESEGRRRRRQHCRETSDSHAYIDTAWSCESCGVHLAPCVVNICLIGVFPN